MGPSPEGCLEESSVVGQEGKGLWEERNSEYRGTEAWRGIVWGMTAVQGESGWGQVAREQTRGEVGGSQIPMGPPRAKLGSLNVILKPAVGVGKRRPDSF